MIFGHQTVVDEKKLANSVCYRDTAGRNVFDAGEVGWIQDNPQIERIKEQYRQSTEMGQYGF